MAYPPAGSKTSARPSSVATVRNPPSTTIVVASLEDGEHHLLVHDVGSQAIIVEAIGPTTMAAPAPVSVTTLRATDCCNCCIRRRRTTPRFRCRSSA